MQEVDIVLHNKPSMAMAVEVVAVVTGGDGSDGTRARIHREHIIHARYKYYTVANTHPPPQLG